MKERIIKWLNANTVGTKGLPAQSFATTKQVANGIGQPEPTTYSVLIALVAEGNAQMKGSQDLAGARWATNTQRPNPAP